MRIDIITVLPELIEGFMQESIVGRAQRKGLVEIHIHNLRDYTPMGNSSTSRWPIVFRFARTSLFFADTIKASIIAFANTL